ncbi:MAG TPA: winged helix DNA-binding domain-containing protein [Candidatus Saccharimonadales bacterium]|nr:winged helix DNA-binding domain-containing protein [Candidatus Saccharimonadales bacterium]
MRSLDILRFRLSNQQLTRTKFSSPAEVVKWFGAVQSQDYPGAKWAIGQRLPHATDASIEDAFNKGEILRTHVMRPTWHFVHPSGIRWMLDLTAPQVKRKMSPYNKLLELDEKLFSSANKAFTKILGGKKSLTRQELKSELTRIGIATNVQRLAHIVMWAELDKIIISGPIRGKQFTYMLLDERVPKESPLTRDEVLNELTKRYFQSHGPATIQDFSWWSGLTAADSKKGIEFQRSKLEKEIIGKNVYYFFPAKPPEIDDKIYLLPNYDEYGIAYKERGAFYDQGNSPSLLTATRVPFNHMIIYKGKLTGMWKRTNKNDRVIIQAKFFSPPTSAEYIAFEKETNRLSKFLNLPVKII